MRGAVSPIARLSPMITPVSMPGVDQRTRQIALNEAGQKALQQARPLWQTVQAKIVEGMGQERFDVFLRDLNFVSNLVR